MTNTTRLRIKPGMSVPEGRTDWQRLSDMTDAEAMEAALADPDAAPATSEQLARMRRILRIAIVAMLVITEAAAIGQAGAGTLDHGNWSPSGCGPAPKAPSGLNLSSPAAYNESMKWVKAYQDDYNKFSDCMVKEANEDHDGINDYVRASQDKAQQFFQQANADSKRANTALSGNSSGAGNGRRTGGGNGGITAGPN